MLACWLKAVGRRVALADRVGASSTAASLKAEACDILQTRGDVDVRVETYIV